MKYITLITILALIIVSCKNEGSHKIPATTSPDEQLLADTIPGVCINNEVPIRSGPNKSGKYLSALLMGETLIYLGQTQIDSSDKNREYIKVRLSDGTEAWAVSYGILLNARPAAIIAETPVYMRPEIVSKTKTNFYPAEFVAITGQKGNWIEVVGSGKRKKGWVNIEVLSTQEENIAVSALAQKEILDKEGKINMQKLGSFIDNLPYKDCQLAVYFEEKLNSEVEAAIEKSIEGYVNEKTIEEKALQQ